MTLMHLCCVAALNAKDETKEMEDVDGEGKKTATQSPCVLQLMKSRERSEKKDRWQEKCVESKAEVDRSRKCTKGHSGKEQRDQIRLLLQKGADPAIISKNGFSPLHLASYKVKRVESVGCLLGVVLPS